MKTRKSILEKHIEATEKQIEKIAMKVHAHEVAMGKLESEWENLRHTLAFLQGKLPVKEAHDTGEDVSAADSTAETPSAPVADSSGKTSAFHQKLQEKAHKGDGA